MKLREKKVIWIIPALAVLAVVFVVSARVFWGYDIFDRSGWRAADDGTYHYLDYYGDPLVGWQEIDGKSYYFHPEQDGKMAVGWLTTETGRYYLQSSGLKHTGWLSLDDARYYFDDKGLMHTGWLSLEDTRYYFRDDGAMHTGWLQTEDSCYYLSESGAVSQGWVDTTEGRYYIRDDGSIHKGWLEIDGDTYYLADNGAMHTGWLDTEEDRYYFREDGRMAVGKVSIDGINRYFTSEGKYIVLVNPWNPVPDDYQSELVAFEGFEVDAQCRDALEEMVAACRSAGLLCNLTSAYRGYNYQNTLYQRKVNKLMSAGYTRAAAEAETGRSIAVPGTSEHQLGLAVDLKNTYSTYQWLAENSWKYGFILRYPIGDTALTGIYYEPWHFRYVGEELAAELFELDMCLEAYMDMLTVEAESSQ